MQYKVPDYSHASTKTLWSILIVDLEQLEPGLGNAVPYRLKRQLWKEARLVALELRSRGTQYELPLWGGQ